MNMNVSEFERNKPTMTYQALQSTIRKYQSLLEKYQQDGKELIMEGTDAKAANIYRDYLMELQNIQSLFLAGR
jgi:hypothetical protein